MLFFSSFAIWWMRVIFLLFNNHSEIVKLNPQKTNSYQRLCQKNTCLKINSLQRIRKLNKKKKLIQDPRFKLLREHPLAVCGHRYISSKSNMCCLTSMASYRGLKQSFPMDLGPKRKDWRDISKVKTLPRYKYRRVKVLERVRPIGPVTEIIRGTSLSRKVIT